MANAYNTPIQRLGIKLAASYGIPVSPYDTEESLWVRVGAVVGANVVGGEGELSLDELRVRVIEKMTLS